jgi:hypothetical protein
MVAQIAGGVPVHDAGQVVEDQPHRVQDRDALGRVQAGAAADRDDDVAAHFAIPLVALGYLEVLRVGRQARPERGGKVAGPGALA